MKPEETTNNSSPAEMSIILTGNKIPLVLVISLFSTLIASIVYATIWLTKLDDRVLNNYASIAENRKLVESIVKQQSILQQQANRNTVIQQEILRRLGVLEK